MHIDVAKRREKEDKKKTKRREKEDVRVLVKPKSGFPFLPNGIHVWIFSCPTQIHISFEFDKLSDESARVRNRGKKDHLHSMNWAYLFDVPNPLNGE